MNDSSILEQQLETELLSRIARQDSEAFSCFYDRTCGILFAIAKSIVRDSFIAEDVLQEVYSSIWEKAEKFDPALGKPISWAIALTRNRALDKLRALKRREAGARTLEMSQPEWKSDVDAFAESSRWGTFNRPEGPPQLPMLRPEEEWGRFVAIRIFRHGSGSLSPV